MKKYDSNDWLPIESAPRTGEQIRAAYFGGRFYCAWEQVAVAYKATWKAVDDPRGEVFLTPTHWLPLSTIEGK